MAKKLTSVPHPIGAPAPEATLPALSEQDAAGIEAETREAVAELLVDHGLSANTRRSYASALRYWNAWHQAAFGTVLPLFDEPRQPVPVETVEAFIAHHMPVLADSGELRPAMPDLVRERLAILGAVGRRQVHKRAENARVQGLDKSKVSSTAEDVPSLNTIRQRVAVLGAAHALAKLGAHSPLQDLRVRTLMLALSRKVGEVAPHALRLPKASIDRKTLGRMVGAALASGGLEGVRDAAILLVDFASGGRRRGEMASLTRENLDGHELEEEVAGVRDGWVWRIADSKGAIRDSAHEGVATAYIFGPAADALDRWLDRLAGAGITDGPVWRRIVPGADGLPDRPGKRAMNAEEIAGVVKRWAEAIGLDPDDYAGHSLRSGSAQDAVARTESMEEAARLLLHASTSTTKRFYAGKKDTGAATSARHAMGARGKRR